MAEPEAYRRVNVWAAVVFSVVFPGLGQLYLGERRRGALFATVGLAVLGTILIEIGVIVYPLLLLVSALDARRSGGRFNSESGMAVGGSTWKRASTLPNYPSVGVQEDGKADSYAVGACSQVGGSAW